MSSVSKATADRNQRILLDLINKQPGNDTCADCKAKGPRWASHNLGIFLCVHCASIHRKIGTHVTKVKSITMDSWSKEQVEVMKSTGNTASNGKYNPNESRHPPPANREGSERDSEMEKYIRSKYEFKRFMAKPQGQLSAEKASPMARRPSPVPPAPPRDPSAQAPPVLPPPSQPTPSVSPSTSPVSPSIASTGSTNSVWNDLMSLSNQSAQSPPPSNVNASGGLHINTPTQLTGAITTGPGVSSVQMNGNPMETAVTTSPNASTHFSSSQPTSHLAQGLNLTPPIAGQSTPFVHQSGFVGSNPFAQPVSAAGLSSIPQSSPYPQQMLLQTQGHPSPALGVFQPFQYQQGPIPNQGYLNTPQGFAPPSNLQQQSFSGQTVNDAAYLQWQHSQASFSSTPQYNQWTS